ncbi:Kinase-like protein [Mycena sanguinolenta]|uniref:Kinase-like protein n=1 Tax=Mycena sanguinolenta TaxID=230812 RepID=A0A8H6X8A1_9AGAR|nr:Kinase-like protein [Mycena sanguinolenta]
MDNEIRASNQLLIVHGLTLSPNRTLLTALFWRYWTGSCAIYILFNERARFLRDVSREVGITRRFLPTLFTQFVGEGASGVVWRSLFGSQVVKVFNDREGALREVNALRKARDLQVPTLQGVVEEGDEIGVIMSYEGISMGNLDRATGEQRRQLLDTLESLHARGIHHHDIRGSNVLVDRQGNVTLIDFDRAELDAKCVSCSDVALRRELEAGSVSGFM